MLLQKLEQKGEVLDGVGAALIPSIIMIFENRRHSSLTAEESARLSGVAGPDQEYPHLLCQFGSSEKQMLE